MKSSMSRRTQGRPASGRYTPPKRKQRVTRVALGGLGLTGLVLPGLIAGSSSADAATAIALYVNSGGTGDCSSLAAGCGSIQTAITKAQGSAYSGNVVTINVGAGTFTEDDVISPGGLASLTIAGAGAAATVVNGGGAGSVFTVGAGAIPVKISNLTITNGRSASGGGINNAGNLTIASSTISGNTTPDGLKAPLGGNGGAGGGGVGGINNSGTLSIAASTISGNATGGGGQGGLGGLGGTGGSGGNGGGVGGIVNTGSLSISTSTISGNTTGAGGAGGTGGNDIGGAAGNGGRGGKGGDGGGVGGISNNGTLSVASSTISGNTTGAGGNGGNGGVGTNSGGLPGIGGNSTSVGVIKNLGTLTIASSTVVGNTGGAGGGGGVFGSSAYGNGGNGGNGGNAVGGGSIANGGTLSVASSTISGNTGGAGGTGGANGFSAYNGNFINYNNGSNGARGTGGGIQNTGTATLLTTIVANSPSGADCFGTIIDSGYNIADDATCGFTGAGSVNASTTLKASLGALAGNGGPTQTILPSGTSPAVRAIPLGTARLCPTTDQRGIISGIGGNCTIGAVQVDPRPSQTVSFTSTNPSSAVLGGTTYSPTATATSGLAVVISLDPASTGCASVNNIISFTGAGTCLINANQGGSVDNMPAARVQQSIVVSWGIQSATLTTPTTPCNPCSTNTSYLVWGKVTLDCPVGTVCATAAPVLPGWTISVSGGGSSCQPSALTYLGASTATSGHVLRGYSYTCSLTSPAASYAYPYLVTVSFKVTGASISASTAVDPILDGL